MTSADATLVARRVDLGRYVVRHRHVAPLLASVLAGLDAPVRIVDADGVRLLERGTPAQPLTRAPIALDGETVGWVEAAAAPARVVARVLSYAVARELDKRILAAETLDRYRELSLIYDLADRLGDSLDAGAVATAGADEASRLPAGGRGFVLSLDEADGRLRMVPGGPPPPFDVPPAGAGILWRVAVAGTPELMNRPAEDPDATPGERMLTALIVAPLRAGGRTVGVLGTAATAGEYLAADLKVISAIAALVGPALAQATARSTASPGAGHRESPVRQELQAIQLQGNA